MTYRIAFIGLGAIGCDVLTELKPFLNRLHAEVCVLRRKGSDAQFSMGSGIKEYVEIKALLAQKPNVVVEVASQEAVKQYVPACLRKGLTVVVTSVGALADHEFLAHLLALTESHQGKIIVPSGAIGGLDYIQAVRGAPDLEVVYESRKPVQAWLPELQALGLDAKSMTDELLLFKGNAAEAALRYPQNLNVAATVALAGTGMQNTQVKVVVDPALTKNKHVITVSSQFGEMSVELVNTPSPSNPKSSWVVAQSIRSVIQREFESLQLPLGERLMGSADEV